MSARARCQYCDGIHYPHPRGDGSPSPATARLLHEAGELGPRLALVLDTAREGGYQYCVGCGLPLDEVEVLRCEPGPHGLQYIAADCACGARTCVPWPLPEGVDPRVARGPGPIPAREPEPPVRATTPAEFTDL